MKSTITIVYNATIGSTLVIKHQNLFKSNIKQWQAPFWPISWWRVYPVTSKYRILFPGHSLDKSCITHVAQFGQKPFIEECEPKTGYNYFKIGL